MSVVDAVAAWRLRRSYHQKASPNRISSPPASQLSQRNRPDESLAAPDADASFPVGVDGVAADVAAAEPDDGDEVAALEPPDDDGVAVEDPDAARDADADAVDPLEDAGDDELPSLLVADALAVGLGREVGAT